MDQPPRLARYVSITGNITGVMDRGKQSAEPAGQWSYHVGTSSNPVADRALRRKDSWKIRK